MRRTSRTRSPRHCCCAALLSSVLIGCVPGTDEGPYDWTQAEQWNLPKSLREVSGLAFTADGRLFAHDDERAIIYQLDYSDGAVVKRFALGDPPIEDDFEAIATTPTHVYLVTSAGRVLEAREGGNGESVPFQTYDAGTRQKCELEGATYVPARNSLALVCKRLFDGRNKHTQIHYWSLSTHQETDMLDVTLRRGTELLGTERLRPSDASWDDARQRFVVVAAEEDALFELDAAGTMLYVADLPRDHRQAEGVALAAGGQLLIADEGGKGQAKLTIYQPRKK